MKVFSNIYNLLHHHSQKRPLVAQMVKHLMVGGSSATIELSIYIAFTSLTSIYHLYANLVAIVFSTTTGYFLQKYWTFRSKTKKHGEQLTKFLVALSIGFALNNLLLYLFVDQFGWFKPLAKVLQLWLVVVWNFGSQKWWVFRD